MSKYEKLPSAIGSFFNFFYITKPVKPRKKISLDFIIFKFLFLEKVKNRRDVKSKIPYFLQLYLLYKIKVLYNKGKYL